MRSFPRVGSDYVLVVLDEINIGAEISDRV